MSHRAKRSARLGSTLVLALSMAPGCAGPPRSVSEFEPAVVRASAPDDALSIEALFFEGEAVYDILRGENAGGRLTVTVTRAGDTATITRTLGDGTVLNEQRVRIEGDAATETGFRNVERDVIVDVNPDQRLWPLGRDAQEMDIRIRRLDNPDSLKERGTATVSMTVESVDRLTLPIGTVEAVRVRIVFKSDLRAADAERVTERWYTKEQGLVAERWDETVTAFGLTVERSARTIVRAE